MHLSSLPNEVLNGQKSSAQSVSQSPVSDRIRPNVKTLARQSSLTQPFPSTPTITSLRQTAPEEDASLASFKLPDTLEQSGGKQFLAQRLEGTTVSMTGSVATEDADGISYCADGSVALQQRDLQQLLTTAEANCASLKRIDEETVGVAANQKQSAVQLKEMQEKIDEGNEDLKRQSKSQFTSLQSNQATITAKQDATDTKVSLLGKAIVDRMAENTDKFCDLEQATLQGFDNLDANNQRRHREAEQANDRRERSIKEAVDDTGDRVLVGLRDPLEDLTQKVNTLLEGQQRQEARNKKKDDGKVNARMFKKLLPGM